MHIEADFWTVCIPIIELKKIANRKALPVSAMFNFKQRFLKSVCHMQILYIDTEMFREWHFLL